MPSLSRNWKPRETELQGAIRNLEISSEEQKAINEEALSVNEEFQSTNEELLTSKEELQSLNEELTALNSQLQETLERQRTTSNDLQNVLYSTDVATLFLDTNLKIRFFTPATKSLFNVIPSDVGRPLADLHSLAADDDAAGRRCGRAARPPRRSSERSRPGRRLVHRRRSCRIAPRTTRVEGVVITFTDITERKHIAKALERPSGRPSWPMPRNRASSPPPAMIFASRCNRWRCCRACWPRSVEGERAQKLWSSASTRLWARCRAC